VAVVDTDMMTVMLVLEVLDRLAVATVAVL
jgi:hypothetical protein